MSGPVDRFICRREGHDPVWRITAHNTGMTSYFTTCNRCGKWFEQDVPPVSEQAVQEGEDTEADGVES